MADHLPWNEEQALRKKERVKRQRHATVKCSECAEGTEDSPMSSDAAEEGAGGVTPKKEGPRPAHWRLSFFPHVPRKLQKT